MPFESMVVKPHDHHDDDDDDDDHRYVFLPRELDKSASPAHSVFVFDGPIPALPHDDGNSTHMYTNGDGDGYALHLRTVPGYPSIRFTVGIQSLHTLGNGSNDTISDEQRAAVAAKDWPWWITVAVLYGLWAALFLVNLLVAVGVYVGKECRKKNTAAKGEVKLKALRYSLFLLIGLGMLLGSLVLAAAVPWVSEGPHGLVSCCSYFVRGGDSDSGGLPSGMPDAALQCDGNKKKQCFIDSRVDFSYRMTLLYVYIPAGALSLMLLPVAFWICVVNVFKLLRLVKNMTTFEPHIKFTIGVADAS